jgi:hypothetical protein
MVHEEITDWRLPVSKRIHIVYRHPSENSLTAEVRGAFIRGLDDSDKAHTASDLCRQGFKTDNGEHLPKGKFNRWDWKG